MKFIPAILIFLFVFKISSYAEGLTDFMLLDGGEKLIEYGMDTTHHWWAVTQPFSERYRLIVDGKKTDVYQKLSNLTFSPDGKKWACFAVDNNRWNVLTNDDVFGLPGTGAGELVYTPDSDFLVYSYFDGELETIIFGNRKIEVLNRTGRLYVSHGARKIAFTGYRLDKMTLNVNGVEGPLFDEILPFGFWWDGTFLYAAKSGYTWQIFMGDKVISDVYTNVAYPLLNLNGDVAAAVVSMTSGYRSAIMISDEYYEPLVSNPYDAVSDLVLHPYLALSAFSAQKDFRNMVVMSSAEYFAGENAGKPSFTHDGSEVFFTGCAFECFFSVNGRIWTIIESIPPENIYAKKPGSNTIAYSLGSNMIIRRLGQKGFEAGMMVDEILSPRFNWRQNRYEALGRISEKLYLLTFNF